MLHLRDTQCILVSSNECWHIFCLLTRQIPWVLSSNKQQYQILSPAESDLCGSILISRQAYTVPQVSKWKYSFGERILYVCEHKLDIYEWVIRVHHNVHIFVICNESSLVNLPTQNTQNSFLPIQNSVIWWQSCIFFLSNILAHLCFLQLQLSTSPEDK